MGGALKGISRTKIYLRQPFAYRLATHPAILDVVEDLIGPDIMLYQNAAWVKNAGEDSYVSWHQDNTYFGHEPCHVLSVWLALTPSRPESGSMRFLPGSHKSGMLPVHYEPTDENLLSSGQVAEFDASAFTSFATSLSPGEASIHHAWMVHGSPPNKGTDRRIGVTFVYHPPHLRQLGAVRTSALLCAGRTASAISTMSARPCRRMMPAQSRGMSTAQLSIAQRRRSWATGISAGRSGKTQMWRMRCFCDDAGCGARGDRRQGGRARSRSIAAKLSGHCGIFARWRIRPLCPRARAPYRQTSSRCAECQGAEHAGRRITESGELSLQCRAEGTAPYSGHSIAVCRWKGCSGG